MHYFDNPGGLIPSWLINWGAKVCTDKQRNNKSLTGILPSEEVINSPAYLSCETGALDCEKLL